MLYLPKKREIVPLDIIEEVCYEYQLWELWAKIKNDPPKEPFKSDGCSWWPDTWKSASGKRTSIYEQCFIHDLHYWAGYSEKDDTDEQVDRFCADAELIMGVVRVTHRTDLGEMMWRGVRMGGHERWRMTFSWGFGRI